MELCGHPIPDSSFRRTCQAPRVVGYDLNLTSWFLSSIQECLAQSSQHSGRACRVTEPWWLTYAGMLKGRLAQSTHRAAFRRGSLRVTEVKYQYQHSSKWQNQTRTQRLPPTRAFVHQCFRWGCKPTPQLPCRVSLKDSEEEEEEQR